MECLATFVGCSPRQTSRLDICWRIKPHIGEIEMEDNELNLCDCGGKPELQDHRLSWSVNCPNCGACVIGDTAPEPDGQMSSEYWQRYKQTAIDKWNARTPIVLESEKSRTNGNCSPAVEV